jgi:SAM-dependent methyltransferase
MFNLLFNRHASPTEWTTIPWHDPEFSRRMLAEHLNQTHDLASRRFSIIDQQVQWIHHKILETRPAKILDLGCGPGFYSSRFAALGHTCTGLDFSPASIGYAHEHDSISEYLLGNIVELEFGEGYDLATLIYAEINALSPSDAECIVLKAHAALKPGGKLLLEAHPYETIWTIGHEPASWYTAQRGLFSDEPYLCLTESRFDIDHAITQYYVYAADSGAMQQYTTMHRSYTGDEFRHLLRNFERVTFYPSLTGSAEPSDLFVLIAQKAAHAGA